MDGAIENHPLIKRYINYYKKLKDYKYFGCQLYETIKISLITGPLFVLAISKQLSVPKNKELYPDSATPTEAPKSKSKEVGFLQKALTLRESRNFEVTKASGMLPGQKPYRAPIYESYFDVLRGLRKQGFLAFYKGNLYRIMFFGATGRVKITGEWALRERSNFFEKTNFLRKLLVYTICDMILHPLFFIENRYVLQNRLPHFQVYSSLIKFRTRSEYEMFNGVLGHFPKNFFYLIGYGSSASRDSNSVIMSTIFGHTFMYPILTGMRRIVCQTSIIPGMLPLRYLNLLHAVALIRREEGFFKGLYSGYIAYILAVFIWVAFAENFGKFNYYLKVTEGDRLFEIDDPIFEEIRRRKERQIMESDNRIEI